MKQITSHGPEQMSLHMQTSKNLWLFMVIFIKNLIQCIDEPSHKIHLRRTLVNQSKDDQNLETAHRIQIFTRRIEKKEYYSHERPRTFLKGAVMALPKRPPTPLAA